MLKWFKYYIFILKNSQYSFFLNTMSIFVLFSVSLDVTFLFFTLAMHFTLFCLKVIFAVILLLPFSNIRHALHENIKPISEPIHISTNVFQAYKRVIYTINMPFIFYLYKVCISSKLFHFLEHANNSHSASVWDFSKLMFIKKKCKKASYM